MLYDIKNFELPCCSIHAIQYQNAYAVNNTIIEIHDICSGLEYAKDYQDNNFNEDFESQNYTQINQDLWKFRSGIESAGMIWPGYNSNNTYLDSEGLVLEANKVNNEWYNPYMRTYEINSQDNIYYSTFEMQKGAIKAKIKFSDKDKFHCTLWMLRVREKVYNEITEQYDYIYYNGEIDIAECANGLTHFSIHYYGQQQVTDIRTYNQIVGYYPTVFNSGEFNIYTFVWNDEYMAIYINNIYVARFPIDKAWIDGNNSFEHPYYIVLNTKYIDGGDDSDIINNIGYIKAYKID